MEGTAVKREEQAAARDEEKTAEAAEPAAVEAVEEPIEATWGEGLGTVRTEDLQVAAMEAD